MGYAVVYSSPKSLNPYWLYSFRFDGDFAKPVGRTRSRSLNCQLFSFRSAWFIAQNMRRAGYQAEVQYVR